MPEELTALNAKTAARAALSARCAARCRLGMSAKPSGMRSSPISPDCRDAAGAGAAGDRPGDAGDRGCRPGRQGRRRCCRPSPGTRRPGAPGPRRLRRETGAKGRGAVSSPAAGADRAGAWTRTQKTVTPDRARPGPWRGSKGKRRDRLRRHIRISNLRLTLHKPFRLPEPQFPPLSEPIIDVPAMTLRLFNTLTKTKDDFAPLDAKNVRMYVCGPTVYDFAHIGNARPVIVFDVLFRLLRHIYGDAPCHLCPQHHRRGRQDQRARRRARHLHPRTDRRDRAHL